MPRLRLTLVDIMSAVGSAALGLALIHRAAPSRIGPALIVIAPLLGVLADRRRGGRGILGGTLGGVAHAVIGLLYFFTGPHGAGSASPSTMTDWPTQIVSMTLVCLVFGTLMGLTAWLIASLAGQGKSRVEPGPPVVLNPPIPRSS